MEEPFDYSQVPFTFGMCAAENCPQASDLPATDSFKTRPCKQSFSANYESKPYKGHKRKM